MTPLLLTALLLFASAVRADIACPEMPATRSPVPDGGPYDLAQMTRWYLSETPHAVVLVVGGLNLKPTRMDSLATRLQANGYDVLRLALDGHRGSLGEFKAVTLKKWRATFSQGQCDAYARAQELHVPYYFLGYSLGALLQLTASTPTPAAQIFFAPPIQLRPRSQAVRLLGFLGQSFVVPSLSREEYRANPGTPIAAYTALFEAVQDLKQSFPFRLKVPTLVFSDPDDELVDARASRTLFAQSGCPDGQWREVVGRPHHLIIDEESLGSEAWTRVQSQCLTFLGAPHA